MLNFGKRRLRRLAVGGKEHEASLMFLLMNFARIGVGVGSVAVRRT